MLSNLVVKLWNDEAGFIVSAELVLVSTVAVLAMIVGLAEVSHAINQELEDVASAFGAVSQSYRYAGLTGHKGSVDGGAFTDAMDFCDGAADIVCDASTVTGELNY